ncbi:MAG: hypothetical protein LC737_09695 [Chloroflexi bacterium]|nr:hypothetical protein [Chloroflexota bacterium]
MSAASELKFMLLGGARVARGEQPLGGFASAKSLALLCYLALTAREHARASLATLLWGEMPDAVANNNLRVVLANLRTLVGEHLLITRASVSFNHAAPYWLDAEAFETTARNADVMTITQLSDAAAAYHGEFMEGFQVRDAPAFDEWLSLQRERLRQAALQVLYRLAVKQSEARDYRSGIETAMRLLAIEPWQEEAHRQLMTLYALNGQRSAALAQYETCRRLLRDELGVEPDKSTRQLFQQIRDQTFAAPTRADRSSQQVTALACELTGTTASTDMWQDIAHAYERMCGVHVQRAGGYLARVGGDGLLAYFGYPQPSADDVLHALEAAQAMLAQLAEQQPSLEARISLHTGTRCACIAAQFRSVARLMISKRSPSILALNRYGETQMMKQPPHYKAFTLRIWEERSGGSESVSQWRFSLEDPQTGKRQGFADLNALFNYLRSQLSESARAQANEAALPNRLVEAVRRSLRPLTDNELGMASAAGSEQPSAEQPDEVDEDDPTTAS